MAKENWRTYTQGQAQQIWSGLQILLDKGLLPKEDQGLAKKVQRKLSSRSLDSPDVTAISLTDEEDSLISQVEAALWR